jgi:endonuclease/exonuclease/phosphatase family metal-dependent hydrolase
MRKLLYRILLYLNILFALVLLLAYASVFISPSSFTLPALFGLAYPLLLLINLAFVVVWLIRLKPAIFISLVVLLVGWNYHKSFIRFQGEEATPTGHDIKVLSYNVRLFNLYGWNSNPGTRQKIVDFIRLEKPEIICFQEFYISDDSTFNTRSLIKELGLTPYFQFAPEPGHDNRKHTGIATFSSFPIINQGTIILPDDRYFCIFSDILWENDTLRVYNNHLQSTMLKERKDHFFKSLDFKEKQDLEDLRNISMRLMEAFRLRARQVEVIQKHISKSPYPVIVCGDFNDTPISYTYQMMRKKLRDSFIESGQGIGNTYRGKFPSYRIDYIFHGKEFESFNFTTHRVDMSDHYPVSAMIRYLK